jgi:hypothetical protein
MKHINLLLLLAIVLSVGLADLPVIAPGVYLSFSDYCRIFTKTYEEPERSSRQILYDAEIERLKQFNAISTSEKQTINNYSDWS